MRITRKCIPMAGALLALSAGAVKAEQVDLLCKVAEYGSPGIGSQFELHINTTSRMISWIEEAHNKKYEDKGDQIEWTGQLLYNTKDNTWADFQASLDTRTLALSVSYNIGVWIGYSYQCRKVQRQIP
jgi:hypothetical protein